LQGDYGYGPASALHGVPAYVPAFTGPHCAYPRRVNLTVVDLITPQDFIPLMVHPSQY